MDKVLFSAFNEHDLTVQERLAMVIILSCESGVNYEQLSWTMGVTADWASRVVRGLRDKGLVEIENAYKTASIVKAKPL